MATQSISRTDLVGLSSLSFIRPQTINLVITGTKPSTKLYPFFDGVPIGQYVSGSVNSSYVLTDTAGSYSGTFSIPPMTFNTGTRLIKFQDSPLYSATSIAGSTIGSASANFTASGLLQTYQTTIDNTETINVVNTVYIDLPPPPPPPTQGNTRDPLAQSFFTYGITGGCFVTSIDVFFQSIDPTIPVTMEIRELVNGYPTANPIYPEASVSISNSITPISTSQNASVPTKFTFPTLIYLEENRDYCFVLLSNSNEFNVWTSEFGQKSVETGYTKTIFEQPYIGTLFKSENNVTWSAQQTEDIKFTIYRANFETGTKNLTLKASAPPIILFGSAMSVTNGSPTVTTRLPFEHGLKNNDKIIMSAITNGIFRGITASTLSATAGFTVTVIDPYTYTFNATVANSTGTLATPGFVNRVDVDSGGSGYTSFSIVFSAPDVGSDTATGTVTLISGVVTGVTITNPGTGYLNVPTITVTSTGGSGAELTVICESVFEVIMNRKFQSFEPSIASYVTPGTSIECDVTITDTTGSFVTIDSANINTDNHTESNNVLKVSTAGISPSDESTKVVFAMTTDNSNVSPVIDYGAVPKLFTRNYIIKPYDRSLTVTAASWTLGITTFTFSSAHGLVVGDSVSITDILPVEYAGTFLVTEVPGSTSVKVLMPVNPTTYISGGITVDTELSPALGNSKSRYITEIITVEEPSTGARVFVNCASTTNSSFDVYIRTSLTSELENHEALNWVKLNCDVSRNRSSTMNDYLDYEFYIDSLEFFDTYDLKIVLRSENQYTIPKIANYRLILLAQ